MGVGCIPLNRFVKKVHAYSVRDVNVEERLPNQEFTVPEMPDFNA